MQPLNLHIEHRLGIHPNPQRRLHMMRQSLLIALLNRRPLLLEHRIVDELEQAFEFVEIAEPDFFRRFERFGDERGERGVALVEPAARGDYESRRCVG